MRIGSYVPDKSGAENPMHFKVFHTLISFSEDCRYIYTYPFGKGVTKTRNGKQNGMENGMKRRFEGKQNI